MGIQFFSRITIPHLLITMKFLSTLCLAASASAMAIEDTADVKAAKADFAAAFAAAEAGEHAALAPKPVEALPAPALPAYAAPFYAGFYNGVYPYAAGYYGGYYPYAGYGAYPYAFAPYTYAVAPAAKE